MKSLLYQVICKCMIPLSLLSWIRASMLSAINQCDSDSFQHLPRLRFYAVLDDFDIWDALATNIPHVDVASVPPGGEPAGRRNVSISVNFITHKMPMYKFNSNFVFSASEFQFFTCNSKQLACMYMYYQALRLAIFPLQL